MKKKSRGNLILLITSIIWGTAFVAQVSGAREIGPFTFNFFRNVIAGGSLFVLIKLWPFITRKPLVEDSTVSKKDTLKGGILCGIVLMGGMSFQQLGLSGAHATSAGKAGFITALYIILVPLTGIFIKKHISARLWLCVILATIGLYLLSVQEGLSIAFGDFLVLISALFYALHILVIDHFSDRVNGVKMSMVQFFVAAILSGILMGLLEEVSLDQVRGGLIPIIYAGFFSSCIGYTFQIIGQRDTDPTMASLILSLESVFAVIAGVLILNEKLSLREAIGCLIMFMAIVLAQLPDRKRIVTKKRITS